MTIRNLAEMPDFKGIPIIKLNTDEYIKENIGCVYFITDSFYDILYVGATCCIKKRATSNHHIKESRSVYYFPIKKGWFSLEKKLIRLINPLLNNTAGRKPLPPGEKLVPVTILVKEKHKYKAVPACAAIAAKYR